MTSQKGFSLLEVLIVAFVLAVVAVAATGLGLAVTRSAIESERHNVAQAIANEKIEIARSYLYDQIEYNDISLIGKISRYEEVTRNNQMYTVQSVITPEKPGLKNLTIKVSWPRNMAGVVVATFFANQARDACLPGAVTCPNPDGCEPGTPASCQDSNGEYILDCPATGACFGEEPFVECPASGKCGDVTEPNPTPSPEPSLSPLPSSSPGPASPSPTPAWCQSVGLQGSTAEVCSLQGCNDGLDNDGDGGIDFGLDMDENGRCNGPNCTPPDPQCVALARDGGLFEPDGPCVRQAPFNDNDCSGLQRFRKIAPHASACTIGDHCGTERFVFRDCQVPDCTPGQLNYCERARGCPKYSTCSNPLGAFSGTTQCTGQNCCPDNVPKCGGRGCFECFASPPIAGGVDACPTVISFDDRKNWDGRSGDWQCKGGKCVECKTISANVKDSNCQNRKPYCANSQCVECNLDSQCPAGQKCLRHTCQ